MRKLLLIITMAVPFLFASNIAEASFFSKLFKKTDPSYAIYKRVNGKPDKNNVWDHSLRYPEKVDLGSKLIQRMNGNKKSKKKKFKTVKGVVTHSDKMKECRSRRMFLRYGECTDDEYANKH